MNQNIMDGMNTIRGVDTSSIKMAIVKYLPVDTKKPVAPAITSRDKTDRGWKHPATAELLCPLEWPATQETYTAIQEGRKKLTAEYWPRFLYPSGRQYDEKDLETGLLHSHLPLRVAKHIFQGPSAALERPGYHRGKRSNAQIIGLTSMTPYTIAYVVVQVRHALASQPVWSTVDVFFDYSAFFWNIVHLFDDGECQNVIELFNYHIFGPTKEPVIGEEESSKIPDLERIKAERARKRARLDVA